MLRILGKLWRKMAECTNLLTYKPEKLRPPLAVRGMKDLDRSLFDATITVPCLVADRTSLNIVTPLIKRHFLKLSKVKAVQDHGQSGAKKIIYLNPATVSQLVMRELCAELKSLQVDVDFETKQLHLTLENWPLSDCFEAILPENQALSGFTETGHVVQFTLREQFLPYKRIIGQLTLDKVESCRTVINKTENVTNLYRNFTMELLAGEPNLVTTAVENGFKYQLDLGKVFWNSRLGSEHQLICDEISSGSTVYDVCAGVGPFCIPLARKKRRNRVFANDLNPDCVEFLKKNAKLNQVDLCDVCNLDAAEFIRNQLKSDLEIRLSESSSEEKFYCLMNLPAMAVTFLPNFVSLLDPLKVRNRKFVFVIFCYTFVKGANEESRELEAKRILDEQLGKYSDSLSNLKFRFVRKVAPCKDQFCVSFQAEKLLLFGEEEINSDAKQPDTKRQRISS